MGSPTGAAIDLSLDLARPLRFGEATHPQPFTTCGEQTTGGIRLEHGRLVGRLAPGGTVTLRWHEPPRYGEPLAAPALRLGE